MSPSLKVNTYFYAPSIWGAGLLDFAISPNGLLLAVHCSPDGAGTQDNLFVYDLEGRVRFAGNSPWPEGYSCRGLAFWQDHQHLLLAQPVDTHDFTIAAGLAVVSLGARSKVEKPFARIKNQLDLFHDYQLAAQGERVFLYGGGIVTCLNAGFGEPQTLVIPRVEGSSQARVAPNGRAAAYFSPVMGGQVFELPKNGAFSTQPARLVWESSRQEAGFLTFMRDSRSFLVRENYNQLRLYGIGETLESTSFPLNVDALTGDFSPDGKLLALAGSDGSVSLLDANDFSLLQSIPGAHASELMPVRQIQFSLDSRSLISIGERDAIVWDVF